MSEENVETLRAVYDGVQSRRFRRGECELVRPDAGVHSPRSGSAAREARTAIREWMEPDAFEKQQFEPLDFEVNSDRVLTRQRLRARGAGSGIELDVETWVVFTFDNGLVARGEVYPLGQEDEARRAAGLEEYAMSEENVEIAKGWLDRWNRGERSVQVDEIHSDVEVVSRFRPEPYRGLRRCSAVDR